MGVEYEVRFLDIDVDDIKKRLEQAGASKKFDRLFKIRAFAANDYDDHDVIRLRDEGNKITLCHKKAKEGGDVKSEEYTVEVCSFNKALDFIRSLGYKEKTAIEKRRISYELKNGKVDIDTWPKIPTYMEIEANSENEIKSICKMLKLNYDESYNGNAYDIYRKYGIEPNDYKVLTFKEEEKFQASKTF